MTAQRDDLAALIEGAIFGADTLLREHHAIESGRRGADAVLSRFRLIPVGDARAQRIIDAALLAIADRAPLFDGPPPANTNPFDAPAYEGTTR